MNAFLFREVESQMQPFFRQETAAQPTYLAIDEGSSRHFRSPNDVLRASRSEQQMPPFDKDQFRELLLQGKLNSISVDTSIFDRYNCAVESIPLSAMNQFKETGNLHDSNLSV